MVVDQIVSGETTIKYDVVINASDQNDNLTASNLIENGAVQAIFYFVYTVIFVLGIFGNALVCFVVFRSRAMHTVTNLFIANLALSDILLCMLAVPSTPLYTFLGRWIFGSLLCHVMPYAQGCSVYISTLTLTSIAIDRFFVIIHPFKPRMKLKTCLILISQIWTFSLFVTFPYGFYMYYRDSRYCDEAWPSEKIRKAYSAITTILQFILPFFIIAFCYMRVSRKLNLRMKTRPGSKNSRKEDLERERKRRTNRMLIAMVAIFAISWMPLNIINVYSDFYDLSEEWFYLPCFFIAHTIAMSSTCYNPFLYSWLNENFRKEFKTVLHCLDTKDVIRRHLPGDKLNKYDMDRSGNVTDTIQDTLLTSTVRRMSSIRYGPESNLGKQSVTTNSQSADAGETNISNTSTEDCFNLSQYPDKLIIVSEDKPLVTIL